MIILQDTREKLPWSFISYDNCKEQKVHSLSAGDYTLLDYTDLIIIERKRTVNEIANNLGKKYKQFKTEMEKLKRYRFKYVVCEFLEAEVAIYPTGLPPFIKKKIKVGGKFLIKRIAELIDNYEIEFIYCNNRYDAQDKAFELIKTAKEIYDQENTI